MTPRTLLAAGWMLLLCGPAAAAMTLTSTDFRDGAALPAAHIYPRCGGQNVSPQLSWRGAPAGTDSFVLTVIDVSVKPKGWTHWIVVNLPATATSLARGAQSLPAPAQGVVSNFGDASYDGPCPPPGTGTHRYEFTIWAIPRGTAPAIRPDQPANEVSALLSTSAIEHATIAATVSAR